MNFKLQSHGFENLNKIKRIKGKLHGGIGRLRGSRGSFINRRIMVFEGSTLLTVL